MFCAVRRGRVICSLLLIWQFETQEQTHIASTVYQAVLLAFALYVCSLTFTATPWSRYYYQHSCFTGKQLRHRWLFKVTNFFVRAGNWSQASWVPEVLAHDHTPCLWGLPLGPLEDSILVYVCVHFWMLAAPSSSMSRNAASSPLGQINGTRALWLFWPGSLDSFNCISFLIALPLSAGLWVTSEASWGLFPVSF